MTKFIRQNYLYLLVIVIALLVSVVTLSVQSIRLDESQSIWVATKSFEQIFQLDAQDVLVPFYEVLLHVWMQFFGSSVLAARSLSFLFFLITLPVLYKLARETSNQRVAIITITLFSLSPFIMWYSSEARMYSLFAFVTTLNHLFFVRMCRSEGKGSKVGYLITTILGLYTHYFFIFLLATQFFYLVWRIVTKQPRSTYVMLVFFIIMVLAGLCFAPWFLYFLSMGAASNSQPLIPPPTSYNVFQAFINFLFGFQSNSIQSMLVALWPIFVLTFFFIFTKREEKAGESINYFAFATFLPVILIFLGSYLRPIFLTRYLILITPTLFILIAWIFSGYYKQGSRIVFGGLFLVMFGLLVYQNISTTTPLKEDYAGVSQYLESTASPTDIILVSAPFTVYPVEYTYQGNTKIATIPLWDRFSQGAIPTYSHSKLVSQITSYQSLYSNVFLVLSYNQGYESDIEKYMDTHYKRLTLKEFSPGLAVREYQLRY